MNVVVCFSIILALTGCAQENTSQPQSTQKPVSPHGTSGGSASSGQPEGFVGIVRDQKLPIAADRTIGAAFEAYRYFGSREWKETRNAAGKVYVDFKGLFTGTPLEKSVKDGVIRQGVEVKFVIEQNGNFYVAMVSRIDVTSDGRMTLYPMEGKELIERIYANKEITF